MPAPSVTLGAAYEAPTTFQHLLNSDMLRNRKGKMGASLNFFLLFFPEMPKYIYITAIRQPSLQHFIVGISWLGSGNTTKKDKEKDCSPVLN